MCLPPLQAAISTIMFKTKKKNISLCSITLRAADEDVFHCGGAARMLLDSVQDISNVLLSWDVHRRILLSRASPQRYLAVSSRHSKIISAQSSETKIQHSGCFSSVAPEAYHPFEGKSLMSTCQHQMILRWRIKAYYHQKNCCVIINMMTTDAALSADFLQENNCIFSSE